MTPMISFVVMLMVAIDATTPPVADPVVPAARIRNADEWMMDYQGGPLRLFKDAETGEQFWYATYTIINRTKRERSIAPQWELLDEEGLSLAPAKEFLGVFSARFNLCWPIHCMKINHR